MNSMIINGQYAPPEKEYSIPMCPICKSHDVFFTRDRKGVCTDCWHKTNEDEF